MGTWKKGAAIRYEGGIIRPRGGRFVAEFNVGYKRQRKSHRTVDEARKWLTVQNAQFFEKGTSGLRLSVRHHQDAVDAIAKAEGRVSLRDAVDFWIKHHRSVANSLTVQETFARHLTAMADRNLRARTIQSRRNYLAPFLAAFGDRRMLELTPGEVEAFVDGHTGKDGRPLSARTRRNLQLELQAFFNWAEHDRGANAGFENTLMRVPAPARDVKVNTFARASDVAQVLHQLERIHAQTAIAIAVGCFAGLRAGELNQLRWEDVDWEENEIRVRAETAKTRIGREVPIETNLRKWLEKYRLESGLVSPYFNVRMKYTRRAVEVAGVAWPSNAARHSYGTYHARHFGSYSKAADNMGHVGGIKMFMTAYKGSCTKAEAAEYWKIVPLAGRAKAKRKSRATAATAGES